MRSTIIGFVIGVLILQNQAALLPLYVLYPLLIIALFCRYLSHKISQNAIRILIFGSCGVAIGFAWAGLIAQHFLAQELPKEWEGRDVTVIGTIDSLPYYFERGVRFNFAVERVLHQSEELPIVPARLALSWYSAFQLDELQAVGKVQPGERWQLTVRLHRPHGNANPYGFDYEVWLLEQNLRATGYVRPDQRATLKNQRLDDFVFSIGNLIGRARAGLRDRIYAALPDKEYAGVIVALVIGDQRAVSQSDWKVFNRTGIGHLISISGLHITMIAGLAASLLFTLWRRSFFTHASLPLLLPAQKAAALAGAIAALGYVALAGFGVPAQRTLYMLTVVAIALWCGRITSVSHVLCIALGVVVIIDPWAVLWPGFWLSFGAVAIILYGTVGRAHMTLGSHLSARERWKVMLRSAVHTQFLVTLGLVPLTVLLFGQISLISPIANAVAIPIISLVVTPSALAGSILPMPLARWVLTFAHFLVEQLAAGLAWLSSFSFAVWSTPLPSWWMFMFASLGMLWLLAPRGWPARWLGLMCWLPLVLNKPAHPKEGELWITALDVGQGTALLLETHNKRLLYDSGPAYSSESNAGSRIIVPYLKARGITKLDALVISHSDIDHSGGALTTLGEVHVERVISSLPLSHPIVHAASDHLRCAEGQNWSWDAAKFEMLHPSVESYDSTKWKPNARSCTLKVSLGNYSILLPGDIEARQEAELIEKHSDALRASVLLVPHHGSGTSSTMPFLNAVSPEIALFQVGYRNRYRHPKQEIFERYGSLGTQRLRSDVSGAVTVQFGPNLQVTEYRKQHERYWYGR